MGRGFLSGAIWGGLFALVALIVGSRLADVVDLTFPEPAAELVEVPEGSEFSRARPDSEPVLPSPDTPPAGAAPVAPAAPGASDVIAPPQPDTQPAGAPEAPAVDQTRLATPDAPAAVSGPAPTLDEPLMAEPATPVAAPAAPPAETAPQLGAAPLPGAADISTAPTTDEAEPEQASAPEVADSVDAPPPTEPETLVVAEAAAPPATPTVETPEAPQLAGQDSADVPQLGSVPEAPAAPGVDTAPQGLAEQSGPSLQSDSPLVLTQTVEGIRLPVPEIVAVQPGTPVDPPPADDPGADGPAIERFAQPFDWDGEAPLLAILLVDSGQDTSNPGLVTEFPVPVTVAVDPMQFEAVASAPEYRAAGAELAVLAPLDELAEPADVEVAFQAFLKAVPESVAVLDMPNALLQRDRPRAAQVVAILAETGHGLVTYERGLNSLIQLAGREGVPAATVFREFDDGVRGVAAMKRFLDRAAFQAGVDGVAIVTGRTRPETLQAIAEWTLGNRAATVTIAPLSAVLTAQAGG